MKNTNKKLTSVRLHPDLFEEFKKQCKTEKFTFQKLAERAIFLYITDPEFKLKIKNQINTLL